MDEFKNLPHLKYDYEKPNEYIDPMKPLIEQFMTDFRIQQEDHIMRAVADTGIVVDKPRLMQALTDAKEFYEEGYLTGRNSACRHSHYEKYDDSEHYYCSHCGKPTANDNNVSWHLYCPVCGAKMDGKGEGECIAV